MHVDVCIHQPVASSLRFCPGPRAPSLALSLATKGCRTTAQVIVLPSDVLPPLVLGCPCGMEQLSIPWRCTLVFLGVTWSCASLALGFTTCHCAMSLCHVTMLCRHCLALISPKDIKGNFLQPHLLIFHWATEQPAQPSLQSRAAPSTFVFSSWFCQLLL